MGNTALPTSAWVSRTGTEVFKLARHQEDHHILTLACAPRFFWPS